MTHQLKSTVSEAAIGILLDAGFEGFAKALELLLNEAMKIEREQFLNAASHERTEERVGYANGFKSRHLNTRVGQLTLNIPKVREVTSGENFFPTCLEKGIRSEKALKISLAEMYIQGVSTRKIRAITEKLCGLNITSTQVSRVAKEMDEQLQSWRTRELGRFQYLMLDARYEKVRHGGSMVSCALLHAIGIDHDGKRSSLGCDVRLSEAEVHWRGFLGSLKERGLFGVEHIISDDHAGLKNARITIFPNVPWQRCQVHIHRNATAYIPKAGMRKEVQADVKGIFGSSSLEEAERSLVRFSEKYGKSAPKLVEWAKEAIPEGFGVYGMEPGHRRRLKSTNLIENVNRELKRRTKVASQFPNEASLLRLVSAVLSETSDDWETGKRYLTSAES